MSVRNALRRTGVRAAAVAAATVLTTVALAAPASAHVTVSSTDAKPGGYAKLVFRVPTESDTAKTTALTITIPKDHPFTSVRPQVKEGWTAKAVEETLPAPIQAGDSKISKAVTTVTWTSTGTGIPPGEFDEFALSVGRLPEGVDALSFPADQTYSDGKVVKWSEPVPASGAEPEHPAPQLELAAVPGTPPVADSTSSESDGLARGLGIAGLVLGAAGLAVGARGLRRRAAAVPASSRGSGPASQ